jgi:hypothetical protein
MNVEAENSVRDIIDSYGRSICDTPRMFETLLRQQGKASPNEVEALVAAVQHHVVKRLLADEVPDVQVISQQLAVESQQPPLVARWAVETWAKVLDGTRVERQVVEWNAVDTPEGLGKASTSVARKALIGLALVALAGLIGGAGPGVWIGWGLMRNDSRAQRVAAAAGLKEILEPEKVLLIYGTLGGLAGLVGASVGWMFGGHTRMTAGRVLGAMIGALQASSNGAFYGMMHGESAGTFIGAMLLTLAGTYIATMLGVLVVLATIGQLAYLIFTL